MSSVMDEEAVNLGGGAAIIALVGAGLAWAARTSALDLLVAVAAVQALLAFTWIHVLRVPGRHGGVVIAGLAAAGSDLAASLWPHSRLAAMLAVIGLAVPVMFVHQLLRGAARVRVGESFGAISLLVVGEASLPALLQLRHQFPDVRLGGDPTFAVIVVTTGALLVGLFSDMTLPVPRFDEEVPRGLPAVLVAALVGAGIGHLALRESPAFASGRGAFIGAAVGIVAALLAVAIAFVEHGVPLAESGFARRARPVLTVLVPLALAAPVGFLLCVAVRT
ncbi:MAG: hypothetical protein ACRDVG_05345 [Jatrophihabitantaceae bacterium]